MSADNTVWVRDGSRVPIRRDGRNSRERAASASHKTVGQYETVSEVRLREGHTRLPDCGRLRRALDGASLHLMNEPTKHHGDGIPLTLRSSATSVHKRRRISLIHCVAEASTSPGTIDSSGELGSSGTIGCSRTGGCAGIADGLETGQASATMDGFGY